MTLVNENARLELLRSMADFEDFSQARMKQIAAEGKDPAAWPRMAPLFADECENSPEDIELAAKEAAKLGHIEYDDRGRHRNGPMVRITPEGYAWIRAHDAIGEAAQEVAR